MYGMVEVDCFIVHNMIAPASTDEHVVESYLVNRFVNRLATCDSQLL